MVGDIRLQHFRSYANDSFEFSPAVNIIVGPNGSGKTNLLEALQVLALGTSYRVRDAELISFGETWCRLDATVNDQRRTVKIQREPRLTKTYELQGKTYHRLLQRHQLPMVLFEPNHLLLLHGSPDMRRAYLDDLLEQTSPGFTSFRRNYRRLLAQRNALLKRGSLPTPQELFPWNLRLSELGATIARARHALVADMHTTISALYQELSQTTTHVTAVYHPKFPVEAYETHMLQKLEAHAHEDAVRGFTAYGPHREDFTVYFNDVPALETASRGETRTAILALKIMELQHIEAARGTTPLLLLDDVFSELDGRRRQALTNFVGRYQTFLTTTDADLVVQYFTETTHILPLTG